jgi:hypothetical protein
MRDRPQLRADREQRNGEQEADAGDEEPPDTHEELVDQRVEQEGRIALVLGDKDGGGGPLGLLMPVIGLLGMGLARRGGAPRRGLA